MNPKRDTLLACRTVHLQKNEDFSIPRRVRIESRAAIPVPAQLPRPYAADPYSHDAIQRSLHLSIEQISTLARRRMTRVGTYDTPQAFNPDPAASSLDCTCKTASRLSSRCCRRI